jgi:hypothetical protein
VAIDAPIAEEWGRPSAYNNDPKCCRQPHCGDRPRPRACCRDEPHRPLRRLRRSAAQPLAAAASRRKLTEPARGGTRPRQGNGLHLARGGAVTLTGTPAEVGDAGSAGTRFSPQVSPPPVVGKGRWYIASGLPARRRPGNACVGAPRFRGETSLEGQEPKSLVEADSTASRTAWTSSSTVR